MLAVKCLSATFGFLGLAALPYTQKFLILFILSIQTNVYHGFGR